MRRLSDYLRFLVWQSGVSYVALWAVTLWTLNEGAAVFGRSGVCHPDAAKVLFYWVCNPASALSILAALSNTALTATVWAPVYVAAATVRPDAIALAAPILAVHLIGLPAAIFVTIRFMLIVFQVPRSLLRRDAGDDPPEVLLRQAVPPQAPALPKVKPRQNFGLRGVPHDV